MCYVSKELSNCFIKCSIMRCYCMQLVRYVQLFNNDVLVKSVSGNTVDGCGHC